MNTKDLHLTLEEENLTRFRWWVDSSFNVHWDSKGHSGWLETLVKGAIISASRRQKINAGSSTESELIANSYALKDVI